MPDQSVSHKGYPSSSGNIVEQPPYVAPATRASHPPSWLRVACSPPIVPDFCNRQRKRVRQHYPKSAQTGANVTEPVTELIATRRSTEFELKKNVFRKVHETSELRWLDAHPVVSEKAEYQTRSKRPVNLQYSSRTLAAKSSQTFLPIHSSNENVRRFRCLPMLRQLSKGRIPQTPIRNPADKRYCTRLDDPGACGAY